MRLLSPTVLVLDTCHHSGVDFDAPPVFIFLGTRDALLEELERECEREQRRR